MFNRKRSLIPPTEGELVVTRSDEDNAWYRGKVCKQEEQKYKVIVCRKSCGKIFVHSTKIVTSRICRVLNNVCSVCSCVELQYY